MRKSKLVHHLEQLSENDLREEILVLFDKIKSVKDHYAMELGSPEDRKKRYAAVMETIRTKFASKSRRRVKRPRIAQAKKLIKEVEGDAIFRHELLDVYLTSLEEAVRFYHRYAFESQPLINFISEQHQKARKIIEEGSAEALQVKRWEDVLGRCPSIWIS